MKKKYISLFLVILLGMIFNISNIKAYEETNDVIGQTKFVDKDGNINTVEYFNLLILFAFNNVIISHKIIYLQISTKIIIFVNTIFYYYDCFLFNNI